ALPDTALGWWPGGGARPRAPAAVAKAVKAAGGQVVEQALVKPWELGRWVREQAARLGLTLDSAAAKALIVQVGERQQRLLRELEKLALGAADTRGSPGSRARVVTAEEIYSAAAHSAEWRVYSLADALVGANASEATRCYLRLREQGERLPWLTSVMAQRLREALAVTRRISCGESAAEVKRSLRM